jgi:hypothetical protein
MTEKKVKKALLDLTASRHRRMGRNRWGRIKNNYILNYKITTWRS